MTTTVDATVLIVGAGITGIGAAYHLAASGIPYTILEATDDVGGVWSTHRWHGARCDSDFIKYSFSFKPFLSDRRLQDRETIHHYLRSVVREFGILEHVGFDTVVDKAVFDPAAGRWAVHTNAGIVTSRFLLNGNGYFSNPHVPDFRDAARFRGEIVHTAHLDGRRTFHDKDVILVGSGATAVCCAPVLSQVSRSLTMIQRSPSYIYEVDNIAGPLTRLCQRLFTMGWRFPVTALRRYLQGKDDLIFVGFRRFPRLAKRIFRRHWRPVVGEDFWARHLRPRYNPWEQRIPIAIDLKDRLRRGEITMLTDEIERFTETGVALRSGGHVPCDVCILATGFDVRFVKFDLCVEDRPVVVGGTNLYKGIMLGGVPNYFHPTGVWHSAWTQRSETATRFAIEIVEHMRRNGLRTVSVAHQDLESEPGITPGYVIRCRSALPKLHGAYDLPSIDNLVTFRFDPRAFTFA